MSTESLAGTIGLVIVIGLMLAFSYLFNGSGESNVSLILLFVGIILTFVLATKFVQSKK